VLKVIELLPQDDGMSLRLRRDIQWIRLAAGTVYVGNARHGIVIQDSDVAMAIAGSLETTSPTSHSPQVGVVLRRLARLGFLLPPRAESVQVLSKVSDDDLLRRASPEIDLMFMRDIARGLPDAAGVAASSTITRIRDRENFPIVIFGSNRMAYLLLALLQASGFASTRLINRQRALRGTKARHPSQSRVSSLLATGLPIRHESVGNLHTDVATQVTNGAALNLAGIKRSASKRTDGYSGYSGYSLDGISDNGVTPSLVIVTQFAAPENTQRWMSEGTPHLVISDWEDSTITVGPLVLPGTTPCSNCVDLARTGENPHLPKVRMMQSLAESSEIPAALAAAVSGAITLGVLEFYETTQSHWIAATTEFDALDPCNPRHNQWAFNSACGCLEVI